MGAMVATKVGVIEIRFSKKTVSWDYILQKRDGIFFEGCQRHHIFIETD